MTELNSILNDAVQAAPVIFANDFLRYVIGAGGIYLVVNGLFGGALKGRLIRSRTLPAGQIPRELLTSFRTVLIFSAVGFSIWLCERLGYPLFSTDPAPHGWVWFWISVIVLIVAHDAWFYWTHRLIHDPRLFRRFHRTHHKSHNPTPFTSYAFDSGEAVLNAAFFFLAGLLLPVSYLAGFFFVVHMMLRNAAGHCGYELFPRNRNGRPLFGWMTTVTHHDIHHAEAGWNYGLYFTHWDRWMGTQHPEYLDRFAKSVRHGEGKRTSQTTIVQGAILAGAFAVAVWASLFPGRAIAEPTRTEAAVQRIEGEWAAQGYGAIVRMHRIGGLNCGDVRYVHAGALHGNRR